jgi:Tfp pilus assembly protein PilF
LLGAVAFGALLLIAASVAAYWRVSRKPRILTDKDTIVLADFTNTTGNSVFDGTLRQGLSVQLEQSPFLTLISDERIRQTLLLMGKPADTRLTPDIARQLCLRTDSAAVLEGSIASLGTQYVLGLKAVNCGTGDVLAQEQVTADEKEHVLKALADASAKLRGKLGESLKTVEKFNAPVEQVTTTSLEALQAYSLGRVTMIDKEDHLGAVLLFQRAVQLDPNFAMAYASLGMANFDSSEKKSLDYYRMAYDLRDHVSERERLYIEAHYYESVTGNLERASDVYEVWAQTYPNDDVAHYNLSNIYLHLGQYDWARIEASESLRLLPSDCLSYATMVSTLVHLNRVKEARDLAREAQEKKLDCLHLHYWLYEFASFDNDTARMDEQVSQAEGRYGIGLLPAEIPAATYYGHMRRARELTRHAVNIADQSRQGELIALLEAQAAKSEALFGDFVSARRQANHALTLSNGSDVEGTAAMALALAGDTGRAQSLAGDLEKRFVENTVVQFDYLPCIRAQLALNRKDPASAIQALRVASRYELGDLEHINIGYPIYLRGQAFLAAHQGKEAGAEFQKLLDNPAVMLRDPVAALAHLGLARAYAEQRDVVKAKAAYAEFLKIWKDADADVPLYQQAKAEYAALK